MTGRRGVSRGASLTVGIATAGLLATAWLCVPSWRFLWLLIIGLASSPQLVPPIFRTRNVTLYAVSGRMRAQAH